MPPLLQALPGPWGTVRLRDISHIVPPTLVAESSQRNFDIALRRFRDWCREHDNPKLTRATVMQWKASLAGEDLAPKTVALYLTMIRMLVREAALQDIVPFNVAAGILAIKGPKTHGQRRGTWLEPEQVEQLIAVPDTATFVGVRNTAMLALMVGAGLRRKEVITLQLSHVDLSAPPMVRDLVSKGGRVRSVPLAAWVADLLGDWLELSGQERGPVFYRTDADAPDEPESLSGQSVYYIVTTAGEKIGLEITPHDLRRTFAQLSYRGGAPLDQIQLVLGHASIQTTERYLGLGLNTERSPGDYIQVSMNGRLSES